METDPTNVNNKVLHIALKEWGCHPEFKIPTELRGKALTDRYPIVTCNIYRSGNDNADAYKQFAVFIGSQEVYRDEGYALPRRERHTLRFGSRDGFACPDLRLHPLTENSVSPRRCHASVSTSLHHIVTEY